MSVIGAVSSTAATLFYLVALCLFFKPNSRMLAMQVANMSMLVFFILSVVVMLIRWFQVLTFRDKLGHNNIYFRHRSTFRVLLIILGTLCTLFVLVTAAGTFLIANMFSNAAGKVVSKSNSMFVSNSTNNATTDGVTNTTITTDMPVVVPDSSDDEGRRKLCRNGAACDREGSKTDNNIAATDAPGESTHCRNTTLYPTRRDRADCREMHGGRGGLERRSGVLFARNKFVIAGFLGLSFVGHLVHVCVALCCHGDPRDPEEEGYEQADDIDDEEEEEGKV